MKLTIHKTYDEQITTLTFYKNYSEGWFGYTQYQYRQTLKYSQRIRRYNDGTKTLGYCDSVNTIFFI